MNALSQYMSGLTADGRKALAARIGTSPAGLHQLHKAYRTAGKLSLTADLAARVEAATDGAVRREDCCVACGRCDLAKKARES